MSTAPWDQPRNGSTITLEGVGVDTFSEDQLRRRIARKHPTMKAIRIETIHSRKPGGHGVPPSVCMLISWANHR